MAQSQALKTIRFNGNPFNPAMKEKSKLRVALVGPSGSGKTWTAMMMATAIVEAEGGKIAFLDTEGKSASKYSRHFSFDVLNLAGEYNPGYYIGAINAAAENGYTVLVIDSFSHAWNGVGGVLEIVDRAGGKRGGNDFAGWADGRPAQNALVDAMVNAKLHIIGTMRSKSDWVLEVQPNGKTKPVKIGTASVQSPDFEYEFDVVAYMSMEHTLSISKSRCQEVPVNADFTDPIAVARSLRTWAVDGEEPVSQVTAIQKAEDHIQEAVGWMEGNLDNFHKTIRSVLKVDIAQSEIARYAGVSTYGNIAEWNSKYPSGKDAAKAIKEAFEKEGASTPPAQPKSETKSEASAAGREPWSFLERSAIVEDARVFYDIKPEAALELLKIKDWAEMPSYAAAKSALLAAVKATNLPMMATKAVIKVGGNGAKYLELNTPEPSRLYGRDKLRTPFISDDDTLKLIDGWTEAGQECEFPIPVKVVWSQSSGYLNAEQVNVDVPF